MTDTYELLLLVPLLGKSDGFIGTTTCFGKSRKEAFESFAYDISYEKGVLLSDASYYCASQDREFRYDPNWIRELIRAHNVDTNKSSVMVAHKRFEFVRDITDFLD